MIGVDAAENGFFTHDIDDHMRKRQIRDLLADGQWYDKSWPFVAMPEPYISPWSRLVDLPYVVIAKCLSPFIGMEQATNAAFRIWPLTMLLAFLLMCARLLHRVTEGREPIMAGSLGAVLVMTSVLELVPERVDHHGLQLVILLGVFTCVEGIIRKRRYAACGLGALTVLSAAVSLEALPILLGVFVVLGISALGLGELMTKDAAYHGLSKSCFAMAAAGIGIAPLLLGPGNLTDGSCDAFSAPYALLLVLGGAGVWTLMKSWSVIDAKFELLAVCVVLKSGPIILFGACITALVAQAYPDCAKGPYHFMSETARAEWLFQIDQEKSLWAHLRTEPGRILPAYVLSAIALWSLAVLNWRRCGPFLRILIIVAGVGVCMSLLQLRNFRFAWLPLVFVVPAVLTDLQRPSPISLGASALAFTVGMLLLRPVSQNPITRFDVLARGTCTESQLDDFEKLDTGIVAAPETLGTTLLRRGVFDTGGLRVANIGFHRSSPAITRIISGFTSDPEAAQTHFAVYDYLAVCIEPDRFESGQAPLYSALMRGEVPTWLVPVSEPGSDLQIFRIRTDFNRSQRGIDASAPTPARSR